VKSRLLYEKDGQRTFAVVFDAGDEAMGGLQWFAREQRLGGSHFTAIGAFRDVVIAYFDWERREYHKMPHDEQMEVLAFTGDIALKDGEPKVHAHVVLGRADGSTRGGHLMEGNVRPTLEVVLEELPKHLVRKHDDSSGLALIAL
jgi:predicted DNA-binding protein with PD1-like motif